MASVDRLYALYNVIADAKDKAGEHDKEFAEILTGVKGGTGERRLTSQFIARFFQYFPPHQEQALNALLDLCEDDEMAIRKQAIKDLPTICRGHTELVPKVADILAQLLQMEDQAELAVVQSSLVSILKTDAKGTLTGLFYQIEHSEDELVRERCIRFLHTKVRSLGSQVFSADVENLILTEAKKVLQAASSEDEFTLVMGILRELKTCQTVKGYQQLVDLVAEQVDLTRTLEPSDLESVHRLTSCFKQALPYFSSQVRSTLFVEYMWREVVPALDHLEAAVPDGPSNASLILDLLKIIAELVPHAGNLEDIGGKVVAIFDKLLEVMPLPPEGDAATEALEGGVSLEFSRVECLLFTFHQLAKHNPEFLAEDADRLKDFRIRLQYFARVSQAYQKRLREALTNKTGEELKTEENKIKLIALKTTANINILIKDLFHQPPSYKASIALSWKPASAAGKAMTNGAEKRHTPITFDSNIQKSQKGERQIYAPPRDKYSQRAGQYSGGNFRGRGRGRGRGFAYGSNRGGGIFRSGFRGRRGNFRPY
ncbi:apoptosis inhibitor 5-like [Homarus americanus]|uniref:Apoptosis inhibitor 5-like n=1 Tax=Homarus americanus TaxID=6706 RepID=A0A8J5JLE4_HOMAM|nr:apoptosis inhibitor 5-like [Homarus americanus]KAG7155319.1 Apoptosis inhibitor 5-like [Homarus americanus]